MPIPGVIYRGFVASPRDVTAEREIIRACMLNWNAINTYHTSAVIEPIMWETHSRPELGGGPQEVINRQLVDWCDFGIGCFWTTPGTPTEKYEGGAVEEVLKLHESGRQVMVYFCTRPVPQDRDRSKLEILQGFKSQLQTKGLYAEFETHEELRHKVGADVSKLMQSMLLRGSSPVVTARASPDQAVDLTGRRIATASDILDSLVARLHTSIVVAKRKSGVNADDLIQDLDDIYSCLRMHVSEIPKRTDPIREALKDLPQLLMRCSEVLELTRRYRGSRISDPDHWSKIESVFAEVAALNHRLDAISKG